MWLFRTTVKTSDGAYKLVLSEHALALKVDAVLATSADLAGLRVDACLGGIISCHIKA